MFDRHCSDEQLLAQADSELPRWSELRVTWHLRRCWYCRGRLQELELQAHAVSKMIVTPDGRWPVRIAEARAQFRERRRQVELTGVRAAEAPVRHRMAPRSWKAAVLVGAPAMVCLLAAGVYWTRRDPVPAAAEIVAKCDDAQRLLESSTTHQVFAVEVKQTRPVLVEKKSRLEVWSDQGNRRFAARVTTVDGVLVHAMWRPSADQEYILDPETGTEPLRREPKARRTFALSELAKSGLDAKAMETGFLRWLENREWRPVSLKSGLMQYVSEDGSRVRAGRCGAVLCLTASRTEGGITAEVVVELDPVSFRPRLQTVRLESAERRVEFSLRLDRQEAARRANFLPTVFEPSRAGLRMPESAPRRTDARGTAAYPKSEGGKGLPSEDGGMMTVREVEVHYALHRTNACLGEPVEVLEDGAGGLTVRGLASTPERKQQILGALSELGRPEWLRVELRTEGELRLRAAGRTRKYTEPGERAETPVLKETDTAASPPAGIAALSRYFERQAGGGKALTAAQREEVARRIAQVSNQAVSDADGLLREAWALRRLAERYPSMAGLSTQSRWLLQRMVEDHLANLRLGAGAVRVLLAPIWTEATGAKAGREARVEKNWDRAALTAFGEAEQLHRAIATTFTGAAGASGKPAEPGRASNRGLEQRDESLGWLADRLTRFELEIGTVQEAVQERFTGKTSKAVLTR